MARKPIPLTADQIALIAKLAGQGLNVAQIAHIVGVSKKTLERRMKDTPHASDALEKGRAQAARRVTQTAYRLAVSGKVPAMTMFWLKCRERWSEVSKLELSGPEGKPIETRATALSDEELNARIKKLSAKLEPEKEE